jgi:hypothetical protein
MLRNVDRITEASEGRIKDESARYRSIAERSKLTAENIVSKYVAPERDENYYNWIARKQAAAAQAPTQAPTLPPDYKIREILPGSGDVGYIGGP